MNFSIQYRLNTLFRSVGLVLFCILCVSSLSCVTVEKKPEGGPVFYPPKPEVPRIQFLSTYSTKKDVTGRGGSFRQFVVGEEPETEGLIKPYGVAIAGGKLFVCDTGLHCVAVLDLRNKTFSYIGDRPPGQLKDPINTAVDSDGTLYVADSGWQRVMVYDPSGKFVKSYGDPETWKPTDVAIFGDLLYVCDVKENEIEVMDKSTGEIRRKVGGTGREPGQLFQPTNIVIDQEENLYVSDTGNFRVDKFDPQGKYIRSFGELGRASGQFARPKGIGVDKEGHVYAVDGLFENIQIFDKEGQLLLFFGDVGNIPGGINMPAKVAIHYGDTDLFAKAIDPSFEVEYLILVSSQFGMNKINVYGFGHEKSK